MSRAAHDAEPLRAATRDGAPGVVPSRRTRPLGAALAVLSFAAVAMGVVTMGAAAPTAAAATTANPTCGSEWYGSNGAIAWCGSLAYGEKVRVAIECRDEAGRRYFRYGDWVSAPNTRSLKYCDLRAHPIVAKRPDVVISTR